MERFAIEREHLPRGIGNLCPENKSTNLRDALRTELQRSILNKYTVNSKTAHTVSTKTIKTC
jgi:hypothetical protein